ncbi:MAG TPA: hypothetical protein VGH91_02800 [Gammaproteobacteria bacterium]|jgi:hypothetical protein
MWQKIRLWLAILGLIALSVSGFWGVDQEWLYATSWAAKLSTLMQTAYAVLGVIAIVPLWRRRPWARGILYIWAFTLVMTGATAPVIWAQAGWGPALFAVAMTGALAGLVIWLAPLAPAQGYMRGLRWIVATLAIICALGALWVIAPVVPKYAPLVLHAKQMESFCEGLPAGLTRDQLSAMAEKQGYAAAPDHDEKGDLLKLTDPLYPGQYYCTARFKPDGTISLMNFTAGAKH